MKNSLTFHVKKLLAKKRLIAQSNVLTEPRAGLTTNHNRRRGKYLDFRQCVLQVNVLSALTDVQAGSHREVSSGSNGPGPCPHKFLQRHENKASSCSSPNDRLCLWTTFSFSSAFKLIALAGGGEPRTYAYVLICQNIQKPSENLRFQSN